MRPAGHLAHRVASWVLPEADLDRLSGLRLPDAGHGYDPLGMNRRWVELGLAITRPWYRDYFRVRTLGRDHVPDQGPAILAANHSGMLPLDALMVWTDLLCRGSVPRVARVVVDFFVPALPAVSTLFTRAGAVNGSRDNCHYLLERGELLLVFPEGVPGIAKGFSERYQLQPWRVGHAELALAHRVPVVPVAVVGAEEAWPQLARIPLHPFGAPHLPVPASPFPLPVRFHILYGRPITLHEQFDPQEADDPTVARAAAERVRNAVADLLAEGLESRPGVFA